MTRIVDQQQQEEQQQLLPLLDLRAAGNVSTRNGNGNGSVGCSWKKVHSDSFSHELDVGFGNGPRMGAKCFKRITRKTFVNMSGSIMLTGQGIKPTASVSFGNQLTKSLTGYLTYTTNWRISEADADSIEISEEESGMSSMLVYNSEKYRLMGSLQLGIPYTYVMFTAMRKFAQHDAKCRGALRVGTFGAILEYGVEKQVTKHSTLGATMVVGVPLGVTLRIKLTRGQQTYTFPLHLSDEILLQPLFYGTTTPLVVYFTVKKLILEPYEKRKNKKEREKQMAASRDRISESRKEAEASIDLMRERFARIRADEEEKGGLVVVLALYGRLVDGGGDILGDLEDHPDSRLVDYGGFVAPRLSTAIREANLANATSGGAGGDADRSEAIDVTVPLQCLVEDNSRLTLFEGTKSDLAGFYDPTPAALFRDASASGGGDGDAGGDDGDDDFKNDKSLLVLYLYQGCRHRVAVGDAEALRMPKNVHRVGAAGSATS